MSLPGTKEGHTTAVHLTYNVTGTVLHVAYQWQVSGHFTVNTLMLQPADCKFCDVEAGLLYINTL